MMSLGTRVVPPDDSLERRIKDALEIELDGAARAGMSVPSDRGLGLFDPDGTAGLCLLSMADVARVAATAAKGWF